MERNIIMQINANKMLQFEKKINKLEIGDSLTEEIFNLFLKFERDSETDNEVLL